MNFTFPPKYNHNLNKEALEVTLPFLEQARKGTYLYHKSRRNSQGQALSARTNGKIQWSSNKSFWRQPMKYGFSECFDINAEHCGDWLTDDPQVMIVTLPDLQDSYRAHLYIEKCPDGRWQLFWGYHIADHKLEHHDIGLFPSKTTGHDYAFDTYGIKPIWLR